MILLLTAFGAIISAISFFGFLDLTFDQFEKRSKMVSDYVAQVVNEQEIDAILKDGKNSASYREVCELLEGLCETDEMSEVYLFMTEPPYDRYTVILDVVNNQFPQDDYKAHSCGEVVPIENKEFRTLLKDMYENGLKSGNILDKNGNKANTMDVLLPITGRDGTIKAVAGAMISRYDIEARASACVKYIALAWILAILLVIAMAHQFFSRQFVGPVRTIMQEADRFATENTKAEEDTLRSISKINEIELLADSISRMEDGTLQYMEELTQITAERERVDTEMRMAARIQGSGRGFL